MTDQFLDPELKYEFAPARGKRVLVVGTGGGSDCLAAYALSRILEADTVLYANTKRPGCKVDPVVIDGKTLNSIGSAPASEQVDNLFGTSAIDGWLPRGPEGSPLMCILPHDPDREAQQAIADELKALRLDSVVAVDIGGDSLLRPGRDREMLTILRKTGLPLLHVVVGLGADAECTEGELREVVAERMANGSYRGWFDLEPILDTFETWSSRLEANRTPNIILDAFGANRDKEKVAIDRHGDHAVIPTAWLRVGLVFGSRVTA